MVALMVLLTVLVFLTVDYLVQRRSGAEATATQPARITITQEPDYRTPAGVYFDRGHTWAFLEASGDARIGASDLARVVMGRTDGIDAARVGTHVHEGDVLIELHNGERSLALHSPVDGVVEAVNTGLPAVADDESYARDWICKVRPDDISAIPRRMLLGEQAREWLQREVRRLKVFLATIAPEHPVLAQTMQDGGLPYPGLVDYLTDEDWHKVRESFFHVHVEDES